MMNNMMNEMNNKSGIALRRTCFICAITAVITVVVALAFIMNKNIVKGNTIDNGGNVNISGKYVHKYSEEIGGDVIDIEDIIILNENHTCELIFQDTVYGEWTDSGLIMSGTNEEEYTIDGDSLYLNMNGNWVEFVKQ